jgi:hypothetical protein
MVTKIGKGYYGITKAVTVDNPQVRQAVEEAFRFAKSLSADKVRADIPGNLSGKVKSNSGSKP